MFRLPPCLIAPLLILLGVLPGTLAAQDSGTNSREGAGGPPPFEPRGGAYHPDEVTGGGLGIATRVGYGIPRGKTARGSDFDNLAGGAVRTEFALNYGLTNSLVLGADFGLGFGILPSRERSYCDTVEADCSLLFLDVGVHGEYRFLPGYIVNPWLGANFGLTWAVKSTSDSNVDVSSTLFGLTFGPSLGADVELGRFGVGPFFAYQAGRYLSGDVTASSEGTGGLSSGGDIEDRAYHAWFTFGVRGRYTFAR